MTLRVPASRERSGPPAPRPDVEVESSGADPGPAFTGLLGVVGVIVLAIGLVTLYFGAGLLLVAAGLVALVVAVFARVLTTRGRTRLRGGPLAGEVLTRLRTTLRSEGESVGVRLEETERGLELVLVGAEPDVARELRRRAREALEESASRGVRADDDLLRRIAQRGGAVEVTLDDVDDGIRLREQAEDPVTRHLLLLHAVRSYERAVGRPPSGRRRLTGLVVDEGDADAVEVAPGVVGRETSAAPGARGPRGPEDERDRVRWGLPRPPGDNRQGLL